MDLSSFIVLFTTYFLPVESQYESCYLPPYPQNGRYVVENKPWAMPGDIVSEYTIKLICEPGYELIGDSRATCSYGVLSGDNLAECLPYCSKPGPKVVSCGVGEHGVIARCLLNREDSLVISEKHSTEEYDLRNKGQEKEHTGHSGNQYEYASKIAEKEQPACGIQTSVNNKILDGGREALLGELPWLVGIYSKKVKPYLQICGGTIVSPHVVISAAHCFWSDIVKQLPPIDYAIGAGKIHRGWDDKRDKAAQKVLVQEIKLAPRFQGRATNYQDDIAVLLTEKKFVFNDAIRPACLNFDVEFDELQLSNGHQGQVGGWGLSINNEDLSDMLLTLELPYINIEDCISTSDIEFKEFITSDKICAGQFNNSVAICRADNGGGLYFPSIRNGVPKYYLRGIISTIPKTEGGCNLFTWAMFTYVNRHQQFIQSMLKARREVNTAYSINMDE